MAYVHGSQWHTPVNYDSYVWEEQLHPTPATKKPKQKKKKKREVPKVEHRSTWQQKRKDKWTKEAMLTALQHWCEINKRRMPAIYLRRSELDLGDLIFRNIDGPTTFSKAKGSDFFVLDTNALLKLAKM